LRRLGSLAILCLGFLQLGRYTGRYLFDASERLDLEILLRAGERFRDGVAVYRLDDAAEHTKPPLLSPLFELLSHAPLQGTKVFWNAVNLLLPFLIAGAWGRFQGLHRDLRYFAAVGGSCLLVSWSWRAEIELGQYNLFLLALTILALFAATKGRSTWVGALSTFAVLLKPTQIFLLPVILGAFTKLRRSLLKLGIGGLTTLGILSAAYLTLQSVEQLIEAHLEWMHFLPSSSAKHISRLDNFSLPSLLHHCGVSRASSPFSTLIAAGAAAAFAWRKRDQPREAFHWCIWLNLAFSPMNWRQNFVILTPLAFDLLHSGLTANRTFSRSIRSWTGVLLMFIGFGLHWELTEAITEIPALMIALPLLISAVAILMLPSREEIKGSS